MSKPIFGPLNFTDPNEIYEAAKIHEKAPLNWDPDYPVKEEEIQKWVRFLNKAATDPSVFVVCAKNEHGALIGLHWLQLTEKYGVPCGHIQSLWVDEDYRREGIARELKQRGEDWARSHGAKFVTTSVFYSNKRMIDYNLKLGFVARQVEMTKDL